MKNSAFKKLTSIKMYDETGQLFVIWLMERKEGLDTYEIAKKLRTDVGRNH